jgi:alpha-beta hydrolase superfamily lysophospholipase
VNLQRPSGSRLVNILFLHGWTSVPGGVKPTYLAGHGHTVINPALPDDDFSAAVRIAQEEFDRRCPDVVVGSSRGGAVAMNIDSRQAGLVLLCPAWRRWGSATTVKSRTLVIHSSDDDVVPIADSRALLAQSGLPSSALIVVGLDHRLADPEPLAAMLDAVESFGPKRRSGQP